MVYSVSLPRGSDSDSRCRIGEGGARSIIPCKAYVVESCLGLRDMQKRSIGRSACGVSDGGGDIQWAIE